MSKAYRDLPRGSFDKYTPSFPDHQIIIVTAACQVNRHQKMNTKTETRQRASRISFQDTGP